MGLDFTKVDCTLYRVPPIDSSVVDSAINDVLVRTWQNQANPNQAIESIVNNSEVTGAIASQIEKNLSFQREQFTQQVHQEAENARYEVEAEVRNEIKSVEATLGAQAEKKKEEYIQTAEAAQTRIEEVSAASQRLAEMRGRIEERLKKMGGYERFKKVLEVHEALTAPPGTSAMDYVSPADKADSGNGQNYSDNEKFPDPKKYSESKEAYSGKTGDKTIGPAALGAQGSLESVIQKANEAVKKTQKELEDAVKEGAAHKNTLQKKEGRFRRAGRVIWKVLNYKIF